MRGAGKEFSELLEKEHPESYRIVKDKELFKKFVQELQKKIQEYGVETKGVEIH